jgi:hypothetical protein
MAVEPAHLFSEPVGMADIVTVHTSDILASRKIRKLIQALHDA